MVESERVCDCGGKMEYDLRFIPVIEEYEDFYKCVECGKEIATMFNI